MAVMPGAVWKPVVKSRAARRKGRGICLHVAVSEASSLQGFFSGSTSDSHFYVRKDGTIEQYVDTDLVAYANAAGNATLISVETQGGVTKADSEPWTEAQIVALTRLCAWASTTDGFPLQAMPNSLPTSRGVGYHRLGVKPWVVAGGEVWSSSVGKICPGAGKIAQVPAIIASATPAPRIEDDDMKIIQSTNRGIALVGPNYYRGLTSSEEVEQAVNLWGSPVIGNDRQFDLWVSMATGGESADSKEIVGFGRRVENTEAAVTALAASVAARPATSGSAGAGQAVDYKALAASIVDEQDRRARDGDPATGPVS